MAKAVEGERAQRILLWLGFGLFVVTYGGGPMGFVSGSVEREGAWGHLLLVQTAFMAGTALGCFGVWRSQRLGLARERQLFGAAAYGLVTLLCLALQPVLATAEAGSALVVRSLLSLIAGVFYGQPLLFWIERFCALSRTCGRLGLLVLLVGCYVFDPLVIMVTSLVEGVPFAYSFAMMGCAVVAATLQVVLGRSADGGAPGSVAQGAPAGTAYRLTVHSCSVLAGLGFTWGIAEAAGLYVLGGGASVGLALTMLASVAVPVAAALVVRAVHRQGSVRFGAFIRLSLVICGAVAVALPLLAVGAPSLLHPACYLAMTAGEVSLVVFAIDVCLEEGLPVAEVFATNYGVFVGALAVAGAFFWAACTLVGGAEAWWLAAMAATWAVLAVIPFLPSRSSNAAVLTLDRLPENEGYEANVTLRRETVAARYGLTEGEAEVLSRLLRGMKRDQIAAEMYLSPWTIKARTSAIYKKCGVHSYKELMVLVSSDE